MITTEKKFTTIIDCDGIGNNGKSCKNIIRIETNFEQGEQGIRGILQDYGWMFDGVGGHLCSECSKK